MTTIEGVIRFKKDDIRLAINDLRKALLSGRIVSVESGDDFASDFDEKVYVIRVKTEV